MGITCALLIGFLHAQTEPAVALKLGSESILLTELPMRIYLPATLSVADDFQLSEISFAVSFPSRMVRFVEATRGLVAEAIQASVDVKPEKAKGGLTLVRFHVSASEAIPDGDLLKLTLDVSKAAGVEDQILLRLSDLVLKSPDMEAQVEGKANDGVIKIEHVPLYACFFYMH